MFTSPDDPEFKAALDAGVQEMHALIDDHFEGRPVALIYLAAMHVAAHHIFMANQAKQSPEVTAAAFKDLAGQIGDFMAENY